MVRQFDLDPYIRGKTSFTRDGTQVGDGRVIWHYDHGHNEEFGTSANEYASDLGIEDPPSRPENGDGSQTVVLSSDEDTCSSTDDSENDALDDPHHKHHSSVTVGMAKLGDGVANTFSKITPGPSLHEKQRAKKEARHKRHEERRKRKLEAKKKRLEIERRQQEEEEERERQKTDEQREEEVNSSYQAYLAKMAELTLDVGHKAAGYVPACECRDCKTRERMGRSIWADVNSRANGYCSRRRELPRFHHRDSPYVSSRHPSCCGLMKLVR